MRIPKQCALSAKAGWMAALSTDRVAVSWSCVSCQSDPDTQIQSYQHSQPRDTPYGRRQKIISSDIINVEEKNFFLMKGDFL